MKKANEIAAQVIAKVAKSAAAEGRGWPPCYGIFYQPARPKAPDLKSKKEHFRFVRGVSPMVLLIAAIHLYQPNC